jgi:enterochelin esterase-like enzyme
MPKLLWTALLALIAIAACESVSAGEIRRETVASPSLGRDIPFLIYLPDGYSANEQRYPVLYLLHGAGSDETAWLDRGQVKERAGRLIASGAMPPMLIVMPGCPACWWIDGARDKAETAFWSDLVPAVAVRYRTIERREGRLIAGMSAGGYGAVRYALKYPGEFAAAAALSPAVYAETPPANSAARRQPPFLDSAGKFDQASWTAHNYPSLIGAYFEQPIRVPMYLVSGDADQFGIAFETALLFKHLFAKQPEQVELRVVEGDHSWAVWANAIDEVMRYMGGFAARPQTPAAARGPAGSMPLAATQH